MPVTQTGTGAQIGGSGAAAVFGPGSILSFSQLEQLWIQNGGDPKWAPTMAAVALMESGGNSQALNNNPSTGDYSVGLWQINYFGNLMASRTQSYGPPASLQEDPNAQARAAISLLGSNGAGIGNWTTARNAGIHPGKPLSAAAAQALAAGTGHPGTTSGTATNSATSASGASSSCTPVISLPSVLGVGGGALLNSCQAQEILGVALMLAGGLVFAGGLVVLLAGLGSHKASNPAAFVIGEVQGRSATRRRMTEENQRQENRLQAIDTRGQQRRRNEVEYDETPF